MKTIKYICIAVLMPVFSVMGTLRAQQQDSLVNRNVTVEREYYPVIKPAGKINTIPREVEPAVHKTAPSYITEMNMPVQVDRSMHVLSSAELDMERKSAPQGYARVGFGNPLNTLVEANYPIFEKEDMLFDASFRHLGTFNWQAHSKTNLKIALNKAFQPFNLYASLGAGHEYFRYYGDNFDANAAAIDDLDLVGSMYQSALYEEGLLAPVVTRAPYIETLSNIILNRLPLKNNFFRFDANAGIYTPDLSSSVRYNADLNYKLFSPQYGIIEHAVHTQGGFNMLQANGNRIGVDLDVYNLFYNSSGEAMTFWKTYSVLAVNPYYRIGGDDWSVRFGLKSSFSFIHGKPVNPSLDIHAEWHAVPETFSIYGGVTGDYVVNTMNSMFNENRFLYSDLRVKDTYIPLDAYMGAKVKPVENLLLDAFISFKAIDDQYFFVNKGFETSESYVGSEYRSIYVNRFDVAYSNASLLKTGLRANYNYQNKIDVQLKGAYNHWNVKDEQYAWLKPAWQADLTGKYKATEELAFSLNTYLEGKRYARLGANIMELKPVIDINVGATYTFLDWITFFGKINNLLNSEYEIFNGYKVQGLNVLLGASFTF
jgi:hypothetical protein